jgi:hypothetical protein
MYRLRNAISIGIAGIFYWPFPSLLTAEIQHAGLFSEDTKNGIIYKYF